jgi:hypothetical protein
MGIDFRLIVLCLFGLGGVDVTAGNFSYIDSDMNEASIAWSSGIGSRSSFLFVVDVGVGVT